MSHKKITISLIVIIIAMAIVFAIPGFAETYDELKERFVTREEWDAWIKGSGASTGISQAINDMEYNMQLAVQDKTKQAMIDRKLTLPSD